MELFLAGSVGNQTMLPMQQSSFEVPKNVFRHTNPEERLVYQATKPDGSPLPNWLEFDGQNLTFRGTPPASVRGAVDVVVIAKDSRGNQAAAQFRITVTQDLRTGTPVSDAQRQAGQRVGLPGATGEGLSPNPAPAPGGGEEGGGEPSPDAAPEPSPPAPTSPPPEGTPDVPPGQRADAGALDAWSILDPAAHWSGGDGPAFQEVGGMAGRSSFAAQLYAAGRPGLLAEARALLDSLLLSAGTDRDAA
jgi:hypothetical protein